MLASPGQIDNKVTAVTWPLWCGTSALIACRTSSLLVAAQLSSELLMPLQLLRHRTSLVTYDIQTNELL